MNAIKFPDMISINKSNIVVDEEATKQNLICLLNCQKKTMFGDPYYGTNLHRLFYESNNDILRDLVIDDIYTAIENFMPQIRVLRKDITVRSIGNTVRADIKAQNLLDFSFANYSIQLLTVEELQ